MISVYKFMDALVSIAIATSGVHYLTAYADWPATVAIMVERTCSLMVNGPGFNANPNTETLGTNLAQSLPTGKESS